MPFNPISPNHIRYIKLGESGRWEEECRGKGIIRFGFGTANSQRFEICIAGRWNELVATLMKGGKDKRTASNITNQTRYFFEDDGTTLWITFIGEYLYWGFLDPSPPEPHNDNGGVWRKVVGGWRSTDIRGGEISKDLLSGAITKLAGFQGTSCNVDATERMVRRINGEKSPELEQAIAAIAQLELSLPRLLKGLDPYDFETLVDLVFSSGGWRRLSQVGGTQKTKDIDLELPATGERILVQIKSTTTSKELAEYVSKLDKPYDRLFFVHHSGSAETSDKRVFVIGPDKLAKLVMDAGLASWLVGKSS